MDRVDWIPVDILADIIVELAGIGESTKEAKAQSTVQVYHAVNPNDVTWKALLPAVTSQLESSTRIVTWDEWVNTLRESQANASLTDLKHNPGLKLLEYFESLRVDKSQVARELVLDVELSAAKSKTLASLEPINAEWFHLWLRQWGY